MVDVHPELMKQTKYKSALNVTREYAQKFFWAMDNMYERSIRLRPYIDRDLNAVDAGAHT